jgi:hypothetical protein
MIVDVIGGTYELFRHFYGLRRFNKGPMMPVLIRNNRKRPTFHKRCGESLGDSFSSGGD